MKSSTPEKKRNKFLKNLFENLEMDINELADLQTRWNSLSKEEEQKYGVDVNRTTILLPWEAPHWTQVETLLKQKIQTAKQLEVENIQIQNIDY